MANVLVLLTDSAFTTKCLKTVEDCRTIGNYKGDIIILCDNNTIQIPDFWRSCKTLGADPVVLPKINVDGIVEKVKARPFSSSDGRELTKLVQWQKINVFHPFFKKWENIMYIDAGMHIFGDINIFFTFAAPGVLTVHNDSYPEFRTTLGNQFDRDSYPELYTELSKTYELSRMNFQSGTIIFKSSLIQSDTIDDIMKLANKYTIARNNEQSILNLYFYTNWTMIPLCRDGQFMYDYWERFDFHASKYLMLKYPRTA